MPKVKLLTSYRDRKKGTVLTTDQEKCEELVSLGRAKWEGKKPKALTPKKKKGGYKTK